LLKYKLSYAKNRAKELDPKSYDDEEDDDDIVDLHVGIIGCGQVGTMILTKLLEVIPHFQGLKILVSTRQPHLLKEFKQEFNIEVEFDNEKVAKK
jgi:predicted homoserine dehydrogenase-like protein